MYILIFMFSVLNSEIYFFLIDLIVYMFVIFNFFKDFSEIDIENFL